MSKLETRAQVLWLDANRIIHVETKAGFSIGLTDAEETIRACAELTGGGCRPALIDMQNSQGIDRDARTFFASPVCAKYQSATALLVKSPLSRAMGNFFLGLNKPTIPTRLFTDEVQALTWLRTFE